MSSSETSALPYVAPEDPSVKIWRYMDFTRFLSLLETGSLWFCRVDLLGDPFEGSTPRGDVDYWERMREEKPEKIDTLDHDERFFRGMAGYSRRMSFANCWHANEHESAAMWQQYSRDGASIAIQSSYIRFRGVLQPSIQLGLVQYIDYETEAIPHSNIINYCMHKRLSFEHERELRALIWTVGGECPGTPHSGADGKVEGVSVPVDVGSLVERVVVAPNSPIWLEDLVGALLRRYGVKVVLGRSAMESTPLF
jgi:hypothetical protein